jgi:hypothetical protein
MTNLAGIEDYSPRRTMRPQRKKKRRLELIHHRGHREHRVKKEDNSPQRTQNTQRKKKS